MSMQQSFFSIFVCVFLVGSLPANAVDEVNVNKEGFAVHGMDVVSYHGTGLPLSGTNKHVGEFEGAKYRFASADNLAKFKQNPAMYVPAYGGWCAYGVRVGKKFDVDPNVYRLKEGRLFLQLDKGTQKVWLNQVEKNIAIADRLWPRLKEVSPKTLNQ
ncbi:MAG TPA: YHS domain protein [Rhodospirillaceae bacterium]|nr:YHS domain protein [Rhodospirillaceae bacterium]HAT34701.1 YHS domain protein [Rhodospirillaceae bacterium]|tara:strand:- start:173 stop:646 length:474 start_codon:yes stop_codon:yes gene_type:complete